jgi:HEAT repeat protein
MADEILKANDLAAQGAALDALSVAARQVALYTATHPAATAALEDAREALRKVIPEGGEATLAVSRDQLLWDGKPAPVASLRAAELRQRLRQRFVARVIFRPDLEAKDLAAFVDLLSSDPEDIEKAGGARSTLESLETSNIVVEDVDFGKYLRESELQWIQTITGGAATSLAPVANLVGVCIAAAGLPAGEERRMAEATIARPALIDFGLPFLSEPTNDNSAQAIQELEAPDITPEDYLALSLANVIQRSGEITAAQSASSLAEWRAQVSSALRLVDASLRGRLFRAPVTAKDSGPDFLAEVAEQFSPTEIVNIVMAYPGAVVAEPSRQLDLLLGRVAHDVGKRNQIEPLLRDELVRDSMSPDSYENVVGLLLDRVCGQRPSTAAMIPQEFSDAENAAPDIQTRDEMRDLAATLEAKEVTDSRRTMLLELLDMDLQPWEFLDVTHYLQHEANSLAAEGDAERLIEVIHALEREVQPESPQPELKRTAAARALRDLGTHEVVHCLTKAISDTSLEEKRAVIRLLGQLGGAGTAVLADLARSAREEELRHDALVALAGMGAEGDKALRPMLAGGEPGFEAEVIRVLLGAGGEAIRHLDAVFDHPDPALRRELARALTDAPGSDAEAILIRAVQDDDRKVCISAVESLGLRRAAGATVALSLAAEEGSLRGDALAVRMASVAALGRIGTPEAAECLSRVLRKQSVLFRENNDALRCLAARALAQVPLPQAREALELGLSERRPTVREACRSALRDWQALRPPQHEPSRQSSAVAIANKAKGE